jgi:hypothetical protein
MVLAVGLVAAFVIVADASVITKVLLLAGLGFSFWCTFLKPQWDLLGLLSQVALSLFVLACIRVRGRPGT